MSQGWRRRPVHACHLLGFESHLFVERPVERVQHPAHDRPFERLGIDHGGLVRRGASPGSTTSKWTPCRSSVAFTVAPHGSILGPQGRGHSFGEEVKEMDLTWATVDTDDEEEMTR